MRELIRETPFGYAMLAAALAAVLLVLGALLYGVRRGRRLRLLREALDRGEAVELPRLSSVPAWLAGCAPLVVLAFTVAAISSARSAFLAATSAQDAKSAWHMVVGVAGQINAIYLAGPLLAGLLPLVGAALAVCLGHRARARSLERGAAALAAFGPDAPEARAWIEHPVPDPRLLRYLAVAAGGALGAAAFALSYWSAQLIIAFASVAGIDPAFKSELLLLGVQQARPRLEGMILPSVAGLLVVAGAAFAPFLLPARRRSASAPSLAAQPLLSWRTVRFTTLFCGAVAIAAALLALRYRAENSHPVPAARRGIAQWVSGVKVPPLLGPDAVPVAPVLTVERGRLLLDGKQLDRAALFETLQLLSNNYRITHPDARTGPELVLQAHAALTGAELRGALEAALQTTHTRLVLALGNEAEEIERPLLGRFVRRFTTGARVEITPAAAAGSAAAAQRDTATIPLEADLSFAALAERAVSARRAGQRVLLALPPREAPLDR